MRICGALIRASCDSFGTTSVFDGPEEKASPDHQDPVCESEEVINGQRAHDAWRRLPDV